MNITLKSVLALIGIGLAFLLTLIHFPILGIAGFLALGVLIGSGVKFGAERKQTLIMSEHLSAESRMLLRPVRRLAAFNREIARKYRHSVEQTASALDETDAVVRQCIRWLQVRDGLIALRESHEEAKSMLLEIRERLETAQSEEERASLLAAIPDLEAQVAQHDWAEEQLRQIDSRVQLSQYSLEHLKTLLTISTMQNASDDIPPPLGVGGSGIALGG